MNVLNSIEQVDALRAPLTDDEIRRHLLEMDEIVDELLKRERKELQSDRGGFIHFVRHHWDTIEPGRVMVEGWPLEAICEHLEATVFGDIKDLLINVPPGFMKSLLTNVFFPAWVWGPLNKPNMRFISFSYAASLTERDNRRLLMILQSEKYQDDWGDNFTLDKQGERLVSNNKTGWKLATSVGGVSTGERGDFILLDDPHNVAEGESKKIRTGTADWFCESMQNRLNDMEKDHIIVIMQRVNEDDVSGVILEKEMAYEHLMIPMEFDSSRICQTSIGWRDPRIVDGELAWEERFSAPLLEKMRGDLGDYAYAGQYQQAPEPRGGGLFKREFWQPFWDEEAPESKTFERFPIFDFVLAYLDCAYTEKEENDPSAMTVWGLFQDRSRNTKKPAVMLAYAWRERLQLHELAEKSFKVCNSMKVNTLIIENKASGISVSQELRRLHAGANFNIILDNPEGDKVARAHSVVHIFNAGQVWRPDKKWAQMVEDELAVFPKGRYKDLTDTTSGALKYFRDNGLLLTRDEELVEAAAAVQYRSGQFKHQPLYPS